MLTNRDVRLFAALRIMESKQTKQNKLILIKFAQEATLDQVKGLLLFGEMREQSDNLSESVNDYVSEKSLEKAIQEAGGRVAKLRKTYMSQAGSGGGLNLFWLLYRKIRSVMDACTKRCGTYEINTSRRQHCLQKCKLDAAKAQLAAAQKSGDSGQIEKAKQNLQKVQKVYEKSTRSFTKRGAEAPST